MTAGSLEDANQPHVLRKTALCHFMHDLSMTMVRRGPPADCAYGRYGAPLGDFLNPVDFTVRCTCLRNDAGGCGFRKNSPGLPWDATSGLMDSSRLDAHGRQVAEKTVSQPLTQCECLL
ncbi:hypothetical protein LEMLEM_LOCUS11079 [Lemmus lemmus]